MSRFLQTFPFRCVKLRTWLTWSYHLYLTLININELFNDSFSLYTFLVFFVATDEGSSVLYRQIFACGLSMCKCDHQWPHHYLSAQKLSNCVVDCYAGVICFVNRADHIDWPRLSAARRIVVFVPGSTLSIVLCHLHIRLHPASQVSRSLLAAVQHVTHRKESPLTAFLVKHNRKKTKRAAFARPSHPSILQCCFCLFSALSAVLRQLPSFLAPLSHRSMFFPSSDAESTDDEYDERPPPPALISMMRKTQGRCPTVLRSHAFLELRPLTERTQ